MDADPAQPTTMDWKTAADQVLSISMDVFGSPVTYTPSAGAPVQVRGVFSDAHIPIVVAGIETSTVAPSLGVRLADLPAEPKKGDQVTNEGKTYRVIDSQPDGQGGALLILQEA